jgi:hypothetical protein
MLLYNYVAYKSRDRFVTFTYSLSRLLFYLFTITNRRGELSLIGERARRAELKEKGRGVFMHILLQYIPPLLMGFQMKLLSLA